MNHPMWCALVVVVTALVGPASAQAQLGTLASPGPLSRPHATLEGLANCQACHEPGRQVTAAKCLSCHRPIADRIARKAGVHREVTDDCVACHVEHAGLDADLRPIDRATFNHASETGFALDGLHAPLARDCARCHKTRSFLTAKAACSSCHTDPHRGSLGPGCATCHATTVPFARASTGFDHSRAAFALTGAHQRVACARCHRNQQFKGLAFATCTHCHAEPHAQRFGTECTSCHTTETWRTQQVDHARTRFPLRGMHQTLACAKCHVQSPVKVRLKARACADCHTDPHRAQFQEPCESCHRETGFKGATAFDHQARARFALTGRHATLECAKCHRQAAAGQGRSTRRVVDFRGLRSDCASCHTDVHRGDLGPGCGSCHETTTFKVASFTHPRIPEFFRGAHATVPCAKCHVGEPTVPARTGAPVPGSRFRGVPTACASCHRDPHLGQLGAACESCHSVEAPRFAASGFTHARSAFALTGRHSQVACEKCHKEETGVFPAGTGTARRFKGIAASCASCHADPHLGQVGPRCETCHTAEGFARTTYTHAGLDGFFVGRHKSLECVQCHKRVDDTYPAGRGVAMKFKVGTECSACHLDAHAGTLGNGCAACHEPERWQNPNRAFHKVTVFPLEGRHLAVPCATCHVAGQLKGTPTRCYDCHWIRRQDDRYKTRLGSECGDCHRPVSWTAVAWNHGARTGMPLNVAHRLLACDSCHKDQVFEGARPACVSCHEPAFRNARNPNHVAAGFPLTCDICHSPAAPTFAGARFDHQTFALVGPHGTQPCAACHRNDVYRGTPRECVGCHLADYQRTTSPNHAAAGFPTACDSCHRPTDSNWRGSATFNHAAFFALNGAHQAAACTSCHRNGQYRGTPRDCVACHQADYQQTQSPNHATAGFPTTCETCHRSGGPGWSAGGGFNHNAVFALSGTHATTACASCHRNGQYKGTPRDCIACHQADYQRAQNPNHAAGGFPTACESCHRSGGPGWRGASFNHAQTFALQGVHATIECARCHANNRYKGTPRDCAGCHLADYQNARSPNHTAAGFPTACDTCHRATDASWNQGRFTHAGFPITSGKHAGNPCAACHQDPNNYRVFTCLTCHDRGKMDNEHAGRPGYRYESIACYTCHPQGKED